MAAYVDENPGLHMRPTTGARWWQRLALNRALEHDADGVLVWPVVVLSAPRQVGKSFLERMVCSWRLHASDTFGEPQDVLHVAHKLQAAQEVWRPAARHELRGGARVRWTNGEQQIEIGDGSRWLIQAATDGAGVAFSLSMALVDEAWRVPRRVVDAAIEPTLAESRSPQLWLVSTAGTSESDLMVSRRTVGLESLRPDEASSVLVLEWSAPPDEGLDIDDPAVWRAASPHWDERREAVVRRAREQTDETEFRQQWLNQWVPTATAPLFDWLAWRSQAWAGGFPAGALAFGVDVAPDRSRAVIVGYCGGVAEVTHDEDGAGWVAGRVRDLCERWRPVGVGYDLTGPAATVAAALADDPATADLLVPVNGPRMAAASGLTFDAITTGQLVGTPESVALANAVQHARRRRYGQTWVFDRAAPDGLAMVALSAAHWAAEHPAEPVEKSAIW